MWAALPACLVQLVEGVHNHISTEIAHESTLLNCGLPTLLARRYEAYRRFISNIKESGFLAYLLPQPTIVAHGYGLRSVFSRSELRIVRTDNFVTHSYSRAYFFLPSVPSVLMCSV